MPARSGRCGRPGQATGDCGIPGSFPAARDCRLGGQKPCTTSRSWPFQAILLSGPASLAVIPRDEPAVQDRVLPGEQASGLFRRLAFEQVRLGPDWRSQRPPPECRGRYLHCRGVAKALCLAGHVPGTEERRVPVGHDVHWGGQPPCRLFGTSSAGCTSPRTRVQSIPVPCQDLVFLPCAASLSWLP